jgi:hypothetical protein
MRKSCQFADEQLLMYPMFFASDTLSPHSAVYCKLGLSSFIDTLCVSLTSTHCQIAVLSMFLKLNDIQGKYLYTYDKLI